MLSLFCLQNSQHRSFPLTRIQARVSMKRAARDHDDKAVATEASQSEVLDQNPSSPSHGEGPSVEDWIALCARAAVEQDPKKLLDLIIQINRLLDARRKRLFNEAEEKSERKIDENT